LFVWLVLLGAAAKMTLEEAVLVVDTQNLSNLLFLDISGYNEHSLLPNDHRHTQLKCKPLRASKATETILATLHATGKQWLIALV